MKMAVIGLVVVLGGVGVVMGQEGGGAAATQAGVTMEQGHPWPVNDTEATKEQLQAKGKWLLEQVRNLLGESTPDRDFLKKRINDLTARQDELTLEKEGKRARRDAVARKIEELTDQARAGAAKDAIAQELEKAAAGRDRAAEMMAQQAKTGAVTQSDVDAVVAAAAEAHVKVEERRESVVASVGGGILPELNKELVALAIDVEVDQKEESDVMNLRHQLQDALDTLGELDQVSMLLAARFHAGIAE